VSLLFLLTLYNLGLLVSSRSRSAVTAMVGLLALWVALATILPKGSVVAAKLLMPIRSQEVVDLEKSRVRIQNDLDLGAALEKLFKSTPGIKDMSMDEFFKAKRAKNPAIDAFEKAQAEVQGQFTARLNVDLDKIDADFERQKARQAGLARTIARLSPVSCFVHVMAELAGTGFVEEAAWRQTRANFKQLLDREIASKQTMYVFGQISYGSTNVDRKAPAPKIAAETVPLDARLATVWVDLALLAIYGLLFFTGAYVSFLRYDVR
jgi:ABC-type transport system involved in multi-copper enzyme maturation permease subunit